MPFVALLALLFVPLALVALMPVILVLRYRAGTARRRARPWVATLNLVAMMASVCFFLGATAVTTAWVPNAFQYALIGLAVGCVLGVLGLWLSRWEPAPGALHYTPNRWLVLAITLLVSARLLYGFWRGWTALEAAAGDTTFVVAFGIAESLGVAAVVLGYYLAYAVGLRRRIGKWQRRTLRILNS